jgi:hypothetical protein
VTDFGWAYSGRAATRPVSRFLLVGSRVSSKMVVTREFSFLDCLFNIRVQFVWW